MSKARCVRRQLAALARPAAVLALLVGILAMHALTAAHRPSPASWAPVDSPVGTWQEAPRTAATMTVKHPHAAAMAALARTTTAVTTDGSVGHACAGCGGHQMPAHSGADLLDVCVAVLLAATVLTLLLLRSRAVRAAGLTARAAFIVRVVIRPLADALRPPSLTTLCVLRT